MAETAPPTVDRLIVEAAQGGPHLSETDLQRVLDHVARAGFDTSTQSRVGGLGAGVTWQGRVLAAGDRLPPQDAHYLRHVLGGQEWPPGTSLPEYVRSIRETVIDPRSGVLVSRYQGAWQLGVVGRSGAWRGPSGHRWLLVEYRVGLGHWVTAYQPRDGLRVLLSPVRTELRWLRQPR
jgi:hypothetical protein